MNVSHSTPEVVTTWLRPPDTSLVERRGRPRIDYAGRRTESRCERSMGPRLATESAPSAGPP